MAPARNLRSSQKKSTSTSQSSTRPVATSATPEPSATATTSSSSVAAARSSTSVSRALINSKGQNFFRLGRSRRATVHRWMGVLLVDLRIYKCNSREEFYPSDVGLSLTLQEWQLLLEHQEEINAILARI